MAISNYQELQQAVLDWVDDPAVEQIVPTLIALAEAKFNRELRTRDMLSRANASTTNEFVALPDDFLEAYLLELDMTGLGPQPPLEFIGPNEAKSLKANKVTNKVRYFTIIDGAFELIPAPQSATTLLLTYYKKIPALASASTNWLLTKSPDLYLYSVLLEAAPYMKNDVRLQLWAAARQQVMDAMNIESERSMRQTTQLAARRRGF